MGASEECCSQEHEVCVTGWCDCGCHDPLMRRLWAAVEDPGWIELPDLRDVKPPGAVVFRRVLAIAERIGLEVRFKPREKGAMDG